jgi:hypothetical protein
MGVYSPFILEIWGGHITNAAIGVSRCTTLIYT